MTRTLENYLKDLGTLIRDEAIAARHAEDHAGEDRRDFHAGRAMAYYEVVTLMQSQADGFGVPLSTIGLADFDADRELLVGTSDS